jgi:hypothetical protein
MGPAQMCTPQWAHGVLVSAAEHRMHAVRGAVGGGRAEAAGFASFALPDAGAEAAVDAEDRAPPLEIAAFFFFETPPIFLDP